MVQYIFPIGMTRIHRNWPTLLSRSRSRWPYCFRGNCPVRIVLCEPSTAACRRTTPRSPAKQSQMLLLHWTTQQLMEIKCHPQFPSCSKAQTPGWNPAKSSQDPSARPETLTVFSLHFKEPEINLKDIPDKDEPGLMTRWTLLYHMLLETGLILKWTQLR